MRIRKRKVPFPLSSLSPVPLSTTDPQSPMVQLHLNPHQNLYPEDDTDIYFNSQPADQLNQPIGGGDAGNDLVEAAQEEHKVLVEQGEKKRDGEGGGEMSNNTRSGSILGAETLETTVALQQANSSHPVVGRWFEGERAFPLKKRRGSLDRRSSKDLEMAVMEKDSNNNKKKMKTKVNNKCVQPNTDNQEVMLRDRKEEIIKDSFNNGGNTTTNTTTTANSSSAKRKSRGGALMEGSRCSRVNGRGWRCCQQTLVGYSLCEHHLGKGRLRSMTSVRKRSVPSNSTTTTTASAAKKVEDPSPPSSTIQPLPRPNSTILLSFEEKNVMVGLNDDKVEAINAAKVLDDDDEDDKKKPLMITGKKKTKLGMVKARSISSLLGQANNASAVAADDDNMVE